MNTKTIFTALALTVACSATSFAQDMKTKSDDEKTKTTVDGMMTKTKMADDGKMKVKGKSAAGDKMKAKTQPRSAADRKKMGMADNAMSNGVMVGGAMMTPDKDIVDNAAGSADHTTLVAAVKAAGLVETLKSAGPFTVFAPTNAAFDKLPAGTVNSLVTPEMKPTLTKILTYHVVPGRLTAADLKNGQVLTTVEGEQLTVMISGSNVMLKDAKGGMATVTIPNVMSSNGVTHVIDTVLMPAK
ncbi:putative surface protein with fasciclin (FAS1) repeats [Hymenobacter sp. 1B]|uniref:Surface protein with fasciclin (FAS1) repeats n=2 Tax=Hymenobacter artigasi TaxID=2719616 RepID=A0ABX1HN56_9BACT|nr:putative surface protein with fasciclin (FAS1) repeats [Hymenobacter artigasi]